MKKEDIKYMLLMSKDGSIVEYVDCDKSLSIERTFENKDQGEEFKKIIESLFVSNEVLN